MKRYIKFILVAILFFMLVLVRAFASDIFYDPFVDYYKNDYLYKGIPEINTPKFFLHIFLRYMLNAFISVGIIYTLFQKQFLKFSVQFYTIAFVILGCLLFAMSYWSFFSNFTIIFG